MGGLDCRFLISNIHEKTYRVLSLTTVATPHHGSEVADYVVNLIEDLKKITPGSSKPKLFPSSIYELTTNYLKFFNKNTLDDPKVSYFSYGACFQPRWYNAFYMTWKVIYNLSGGKANDGMVTVDSSKWGHYRGCLTNTDHLDLINWKNKLQKDLSKSFLSKTAQRTIRPEIDILNFYLYIADDLAKRGFWNSDNFLKASEFFFDLIHPWFLFSCLWNLLCLFGSEAQFVLFESLRDHNNKVYKRPTDTNRHNTEVLYLS